MVLRLLVSPDNAPDSCECYLPSPQVDTETSEVKRLVPGHTTSSGRHWAGSQQSGEERVRYREAGRGSVVCSPKTGGLLGPRSKSAQSG